ncbi:hypothetical protein L6452_30041 [Arctium lappa]|uniref:Uncharacterized protein n=1 Tax=Arctium lappa TaxID=4217 RepID=A0ACB8ZIQ6_ARCLA|nr:hypothetical protein L6452_30041 [Arctium lappa]
MDILSELVKAVEDLVCMPESLDKDLVRGNGYNARVKEGEVVKNVGGTTVIISNFTPQSEGLISDSYTIPLPRYG